MNVNAEGGLDLTPQETESLARRVIARLLADHECWLDWEDFPKLSQGAFDALDQTVKDLAGHAHEASRHFDFIQNVDSANVLEASS